MPVAPAQVPQRLTRGAGRYQQPVVILTRLGVDLSVQGEGLGRALVVDALRRVVLRLGLSESPVTRGVAPRRGRG